MNSKLVLAAFVAAGLGLAVTSPAHAFGWKKDCCTPCCAPAYETKIEYVHKVVCSYKAVTHTKQVPCCITRCVPVECEGKVTVTVMEPEYKDEEKTGVFNTYKAHTVEKDVPVCTTVKETCIDPCTGCSHTVCKQVTVMKKTCETVMECVPETRKYTIRTTVCKPVEKTFTTKKTTFTTVNETIMKTVSYCEMVPCQTVVKVPVYVKVPVCPVCTTCSSCAAPSCCH